MLPDPLEQESRDWTEQPPPQVTVAMPAYNAGPFIREAIESVLQQEGIDLELIVVDDQSRDDTAAIVESFRDPRLTLHRNTRRRGIAACHNLIVRKSRAPYIAHVDADDVILPGALRKLVDALAADPAIGQAHCHFFSIDANGLTTRDDFAFWYDRLRRDRPTTLDYRAALPRENVANALRTYRRAALYAAGEFDERLTFGVDYDMALRILERHRITLVPEFLLARRVHGGNTTEGLWFQSFRIWWAGHRIRRRLVRSGGVSFVGDGDGELSSFLRSRAGKAQRGLRAALARSLRRGSATLRWRWWAPRAAALHRRAVQWLSWWPLSWRQPRPAGVPGTGPTLVYYTRVFPALSETFIQREVAALREAGVPLEVVSEAAHDEQLDDEARAHLSHTTVLGPPRAIAPGLLWSFLVRRPLAVLNLFLYVLLHRHGASKAWHGDRAAWRRAVRLGGLLRERGATHVHAPWSGADALVALLASRLAGARYTVQARASDLYGSGAQNDLQERLGYADFIITNAEYNVPAIRAALRSGAPTPVHVIHEGVDPRQLAPPAQRPGNSPLRILCVARLVEPKGIDVLLRACRILKEQGHRFHCEILGGRVAAEAAYYIAVRKLWRSLELDDEVQFLGARPFAAVRERYAQADIFALAAVPAADGRRDVTPNTVIEAMAMGLPIVSTSSGAITELVEDGRSALLVPPHDEHALAGALARLLGDAELRRALGSAARRRAEERFDIRKNAVRYAELFGFR